MTDKRAQWEKIKSVDPKLAELLEKVKQTFGKPESVTVRFKQ